MIIMACKVPGHCSTGHVFNVKNMTLEPMNDSILSFSNIFIFPAVNKIVVLTCAMPYGVVHFGSV